MTRTIPVTHFHEYLAQARTIQDALGDQPDPAAVQQAVVRLADLVVGALDEAMQTFEGFAMIVMALHRDVTRGPASPPRRTAPVPRRRPRPPKK